MESKRDIDSFGVTIWSEANGNIYASGGPEQIVVKGDLHILGIPAIQDDLIRLRSQQEICDPPASVKRGGRINYRGDLAVFMASQEQKNFIGKALNFFFLSEHLRGQFSGSRGELRGKMRIGTVAGAQENRWDQ